MQSASRVGKISFRPAGFHGNYSASMGLSMSPKPVTIMRGCSAPLCSLPHWRSIFEKLWRKAGVEESGLIERATQPQELKNWIIQFGEMAVCLTFYAHLTTVKSLSIFIPITYFYLFSWDNFFHGQLYNLTKLYLILFYWSKLGYHLPNLIYFCTAGRFMQLMHWLVYGLSTFVFS